MTLDGIEKLLKEHFPKMKVYFIRYADDFLVIVPSKEIAEEVREIVCDFWLSEALNFLLRKQ